MVGDRVEYQGDPWTVEALDDEVCAVVLRSLAGQLYIAPSDVVTKAA